MGAINPDARIARDRAKGQVCALRNTPLRARAEVVAKVFTAYLAALLTLAFLYLACALLGVRLGAAQWFEMAGLLLVGLAPFVAASIDLGHVVSVDAFPAAMGGFVVLLGGAFGQLFKQGVMLTVVKLLPSYWLVQAGRAVVGSGAGQPRAGSSLRSGRPSWRPLPPLPTGVARPPPELVLAGTGGAVTPSGRAGRVRSVSALLLRVAAKARGGLSS